MPETCIFCEIIAGRQKAQVIYRDEFVTAFNDLFPKAPVHILIIPNRHIDSINELSREDEELTKHLVMVAQKLALDKEIAASGYRLVINTGRNAGQSVHHLHLHLLGGEPMTMMGG